MLLLLSAWLMAACGGREAPEVTLAEALPEPPLLEPPPPPPALWAPPRDPVAPPCDWTRPLPEADGPRRLALLVGVGRYQHEDIPALNGPAGDVGALYALLTDPEGGFGFEPEAVCALVDEQARVEAVTEAFQRALIDRARPGDPVLVYFSGHGTQVRDGNGDESDGYDEALVLHDSFTPGVGVLRDDRLNRLLAELHAKTSDITVLLDACSSGSALKTDAMVGRYVHLEQSLPTEDEPSGDGEAGWSASLPGVASLAAAEDGQLALEPAGWGRGYFTAALLEGLSEAVRGGWTWQQVAAVVRQRVSAHTFGLQRPVVQGDLGKGVLGGAGNGRAHTWTIREVHEGWLVLEGLGLGGWGAGAFVRLHPAGSSAEDLRDPSRARGVVRLRQYSGLDAMADLPEGLAAQVGDLAVLHLPSPESWRLTVSVEQGVPWRAALVARIEQDPELSASVRIADAGQLRIEGAAHTARILGPEGRVRSEHDADTPASLVKELALALRGHARQQALLSLRGDVGSALQDHGTLQVRVFPSAIGAASVEPEGGACGDADVPLPVDTRWTFEVRNTHPTQALRVGGWVLANDGQIRSFPSDDQLVQLSPRSDWRRVGSGDEFVARAPTDILEHLMILGVAGDQIFTPGAVVELGQARSLSSTLDHLLANQIRAYTKGVGSLSVQDPGRWTVTTQGLRVLEEADYAQAVAARCAPSD
ncbi:MAG: caspase family protein [Alphaproteobacteria bacterium]|nr:caspase family protein [Alphaproteobacteria bacterium]